MSVKELASLPLTNEQLGVLIRLMAAPPSDTSVYTSVCGSELSVVAEVATRCAEVLAKYRQQREKRRAAITSRWAKPKPLTADTSVSAAPIYSSSISNTPNLSSSNTTPTKTLTTQQQNVADVFAAFRSFEVAPPGGGIVASWIAKHGVAGVLEIVNRLGPAGHLSKGSAYVFGALNRQKKERENGNPAESGEPRRTARDFGARSLDEFLAERALSEVQGDTDGGSHGVM